MAIQEIVAPYDLVGQYNQDEINGFDDSLIVRMLDACRLSDGQRVLDAMAGDGNLSYRLFRYCAERGIALPAVTVLEFSRVQSEIARSLLKGHPAEILWGDILSMQSLLDGKLIPPQSFERALIKSANHEIPLSKQEQLYKNIYNALAPDGLFVNLGFIFDDEDERDELREIARVKDTLAGHMMAVENRHFLMRGEFYDRLRKVGFVEIQTAHAFTYQIRSEIVAKRYFKTEVIEQESLEFQISQLRAKTMRRKGKIRFEADASVMECPGEITVARRPTLIEENRAIYERYPYDFLRHIKAHREMLELASALVAEGSKVVDAGCGIGLLAEKVAGRCARYLGIDANPHFVEICRNRMRPYGNAEVVLGDLNNFRLEAEEFDCILALNVIYQEDIEPMPVLGMLRDALKPGGILVLSAPCSADSFKKCEKMMLADLDKEGALSGKDVIAEQIRAANARLLSPKGHYWSAGQISSLLRDIGFKAIERSDDSLYYGAAWLVAARR